MINVTNSFVILHNLQSAQGWIFKVCECYSTTVLQLTPLDLIGAWLGEDRRTNTTKTRDV